MQGPRLSFNTMSAFPDKHPAFRKPVNRSVDEACRAIGKNERTRRAKVPPVIR
jgi:hypothetical protein